MNIIRVRTQTITTYGVNSRICYIKPVSCVMEPYVYIPGGSIPRGIGISGCRTTSVITATRRVCTTWCQEVPVQQTFWGDVE